jgi:hypothetical protein
MAKTSKPYPAAFFKLKPLQLSPKLKNAKKKKSLERVKILPLEE